MKQKYIFIFTEPDDWSSNDVIDWIKFHKYIPLRVNANKILNSEFNFNFQNHNLSEVSINKTIKLNNIKSFWYRRTIPINLNFYKTDIAITGENNELILNHKFEELKYARNAFFHLTKDFKWLNNPFNSIIDKSFCLIEAKKCGLNIPQTIITSSSPHASTFYERMKKKVIIKPIYNVTMLKYKRKNYLPYTTVLDDTFFDNMPETFFPTLFQEKIEKQIELRVFYLDGKFFPMAMFSQLNSKTKDDFRRYDNTNPTRSVPFKLPKSIETKLKTFMRKIDLNCGSIDLILDNFNNYYFLEVNPVGQFGMTSYPCNYYIEEEISKFLINNEKISKN